MTFEGSCNRGVVEECLEEVLPPQLSPGKVPMHHALSLMRSYINGD
ncbi:MAG: hypothetical protein AAF889_01950 [Cyanobacteria bacterium P01_D01_bin.73]